MIVNYNEASTWGDMVYTDVMTNDWLQTFPFGEKHLEVLYGGNVQKGGNVWKVTSDWSKRIQM